MKNVRVIVFMSMFIALEVVLTRFLSIQTPIVRIGFTFLPVAISAMMFGPLYSGVAAAVADILGVLLFPSGAFFPGFTLSAFLGGAIYGLALYKKPKSFFRIGVAVIIISVFVNLGLGTVWLWILTGKGIMVLLPTRVVKSLVMIPLQIIMIRLAWSYIAVRLERSYISGSTKALEIK